MLTSGDFADKYSAIPNFNLVNEPDLNIVLKVEVFVHTDGQLRAAHLILGYTPLSSSFQVPKCVIKVRDYHLHLINVIVPGFIYLDPRPQGVLEVKPFPQFKAGDEATPSQPAIKEEKEERVIEVSDSKDNFEVFNRP